MEVFTIDTGTFKLDGGAMFGVVPKRLWNRLNPADENNLCTWAMRCLLIIKDERRILVDTGIGSKQGEKFKQHFEPKNIDQLEMSLADLGFSPSDITDVFLTHLHFDHVGGAVISKDDQLSPAFPNATYWTSKTHLNWALNPNPKEKASFLLENIQPLINADVLRFVNEDQGSNFIKNISMYFVDGHTKSMTYLKIRLEKATLIYCADLIPSSHHISLPYIMSFDINPMKTLEEKESLLTEAIAENYILIFEHDPVIEAATVERTERGRIVVKQSGSLKDLLSTSYKSTVHP